MSGRRVKQARREAALTEGIAQAHDRLHKGDVDDCHEILHQLLGSGYAESTVAPLTGTAIQQFDREFRDLCTRLGVRASFVVMDPEPRADGAHRLLSGGDAEIDRRVCALMDGRG